MLRGEAGVRTKLRTHGSQHVSKTGSWTSVGPGDFKWNMGYIFILIYIRNITGTFALYDEDK